MNKIYKGGITINSLILFLQTFGIILVVIGHSGETIPYLSKWIYSFHMPLFIFISGYLLKYTNKKISDIDAKPFFYKKIERLVYPYIIISTLAYLPKYLLNSLAMRKVNLTFISYLEGIIYPWNNPIIFFWFLPTIFIIFFITVYASKINSKINIKLELLLGFTLILLIKNPISTKFLNLSGVTNYIFFFILGIYYCINQEKIESFLNINNLFTLIFSFIVLLTNLFIDVPMDKVSYFIYSVSGIIFSIGLGKLYLRKNMNFLNHLYGFSFTIYLLSWFPQVFVRIIMFQKLNLHWIYVLPVSTVLGIYIPYFIGKCILKIKNINCITRFTAKQVGV